MSWNSTFIAIKRDFSDQIDKLESDLGIFLGKPSRTISWYEATKSSINGKSVGIGGGWTILCDPFMFLEAGENEIHEPGKMWLPRIEKGLELCSVKSNALGFIMSGVSDTYGMTIHDDGKLVRCRLVQEGGDVIDFGAPLPEEIAVFNEEDDEEQRVFLMLDVFGLSFDLLESIPFTLFAPDARA